jgi:hypothetical protein
LLLGRGLQHRHRHPQRHQHQHQHQHQQEGGPAEQRWSRGSNPPAIGTVTVTGTGSSGGLAQSRSAQVQAAFELCMPSVECARAYYASRGVAARCAWQPARHLERERRSANFGSPSRRDGRSSSGSGSGSGSGRGSGAGRFGAGRNSGAGRNTGAGKSGAGRSSGAGKSGNWQRVGNSNGSGNINGNGNGEGNGEGSAPRGSHRPLQRRRGPHTHVPAAAAHQQAQTRKKGNGDWLARAREQAAAAPESGNQRRAV